MDEIKEFTRLAGDNDYKQSVCVCGNPGERMSGDDQLRRSFVFRDRRSYDYYTPSALCQRCQDALRGDVVDAEKIIDDTIRAYELGNPAGITADGVLKLKLTRALKAVSDVMLEEKGVVDQSQRVSALISVIGIYLVSYIDRRVTIDDQMKSAIALLRALSMSVMSAVAMADSLKDDPNE